MLKLFQEHIARQQLCKTTDKILLAVSGGIDSMVMLHLFHSSGYKISVAHCNFQLRGTASNDDETFVKQTCHQMQVPFFSTSFNTNNYAAEHGISIQMAARDLRYAWFHEILANGDFDQLATAHHLNDSVETVFLNLIHGRGIDGLTGIAVKNKKIIRPMLFALKDEIEKFAIASSILWRDDASNQTDDYARNQIRHAVLPVLMKLNANLEHTVQRSMEKNLGALELLQWGVEKFESTHVVGHASGKVMIRKTSLSSFQHPGSVLYELVKKYLFSLEQCHSIIKSLHGQVGKSFFSSSHALVIDRTDLIITENLLPIDEIQIHKGQQEVIAGRWKLELVETSMVSPLNEQEVVVLDADQIRYPVMWRKWREGDSFYPLGMQHKKKVSDFLIDRKVARNDKDLVMVLESAGEIFWVVGHQISNRFKITPETKRAIRLTIKPYFT